MPIHDIEPDFAQSLTFSRGEVVTETTNGLTIQQLGGAYISDVLSVPSTPYELTNGETAIETFVCAAGDAVSSTGDDERLIDLWSPFAQVVANQVYKTAREFEIALEGPGYLTASALPLPLVSHEPHFDDDRFNPTDGLGLVATVSTHGGTRCTTTALELESAPRGTPISVSAELQDAFDCGAHPTLEGAPGRLLLLPQFGQLHSGPDLGGDLADPQQLRTLFVFRSQTAGRATEPRRRRRSR